MTRNKNLKQVTVPRGDNFGKPRRGADGSTREHSRLQQQASKNQSPRVSINQLNCMGDSETVVTQKHL
ncbi:hypothetical protein ACET3Z_004529 [Daucus carota]